VSGVLVVVVVVENPSQYLLLKLAAVVEVAVLILKNGFILHN
jgi:hypothetical protein